MLPVLMYHGVHAARADRGFYDAVYSVHPRDFERQLDWLAERDYRTLLLKDIAAPPARSVVISFDDGDVSNFAVALPALARRGMVAEFFITTDFIGRAGSLGERDLQALVAAGMGIQSHGHTHRYLEELNETDLDFELRESKQELERIGGQRVTAIALPGGRGGERERAAAQRAGYRYVLNSVPGCNAQWRPGEYLQRLAITRGLALGDYARLVQWRGLTPRWLRARHAALATAKQLLGNARYESWRERWVLR